MWEKIANFILRNKYFILGFIVIASGFMAYKATQVELAYNMQKLVPKNDVELVDYENFKKEFGDDGNKLIIGLKSPDIFKEKVFNDLYHLTSEIDKIKGVYDVLSLSNLYQLTKVDSIKRFVLTPLITRPLKQHEIDSVKEIMMSMKFYKDLIFNQDSNASIIVVSLDKDLLDTKYRTQIIDSIVYHANQFSENNNIELHYSGLPYVRHTLSTKVKDELGFFTFLALSVTALLFWAFFRSVSNLLVALFIVSLAVIWSMGWISLLDYKITLLTGLLPAIMIVIGIPNSIYLINKYHEEYRLHQNKIKALQRVISRVGVATILTNLTTAIGFGVFYFTDTLPLKQFGVAAFLSVMSIFVISLTIIPILFSILKPPTIKQTKHLENKYVLKMVNWIHYMVFNKKRRIYYFTVLLIVISFFGFLKLKPLVFMLDDIPHKDKLYQDLIFIQQLRKNFQ